MDGKSIKSPKSLTKAYMSKFPSSKTNYTVPRPTTTISNDIKLQKSPSTKKETQIAQPLLHNNNTHTTSINKNTIEHPNILPNTATINTSNSFAETTAKSNYPKMSQAIVLNSIDGVRQVEYITAISKITEPANIIAASRISNNRFCIFLNSETIANNLVKNHTHIEIGNNIIPIRKLINPSKRIILSNVYPSIPDGIIINVLQDVGIRLTSNISPLRAGFATDQFSHITSFRRQIYINPDDISLVPSSIAINFEDTLFRIFLTDDTVTCFRCKQTGHISSSCKNPIQNSTISNLTHISKLANETLNNTENNQIDGIQILEPNSQPPSSDMQSTSITKAIPQNIGASTPIASTTILNIDNSSPPNVHVEIDHTNNQSKRPASSTSLRSTLSTNSAVEPCEASKNNTANINHKIKKMRTKSDSTLSNIPLEHDTDKLDEQLYPTLDAFTEFAPINYYQFKYIIESSSNKNVNINVLCDDSGISVPDLHEFIETIRPKLTDRSIKTKLTKLSNLLFRIMPLQH